MRGGGIIVPTPVGVNRRASPRQKYRFLIVPTPVGVNRTRHPAHHQPRHCPHARGGEPFALRVVEAALQLSPRPWG